MMRAKMRVSFVQENRFGEDKQKTSETLHMVPVCAPKYDSEGLDEDNTYAKFSPGGQLYLNIANPALFDKFKVGDAYYLDFTPANS